MKKRRMIGGLLLVTGIAVCLLSAGGWKWKSGEAMRFAKKMGTGINLGNSLDATGLKEYRPDAGDLEYETFWGNPAVGRAQLAAIREAGFSTVRIPVTWEEHMDEQGNVAPAWMERVTEVTDLALEEGLYVILDTHHESWLDLKPENEKELTERFCILWQQIAENFRAYDDRLLFEGMNEPRLRGSAYEWTCGTGETRDMVNRLNRAFVETVRKSGGENQTRYLLIGAYANQSGKEALEALCVPEGRIIVSVHAYLPYSFCQDANGQKEWSPEKPADAGAAAEAFADMKRLFTDRGIPVILTEFGCMDKQNPEERLRWTAFYTEQARAASVNCIWWDNGREFKLLDRENGTWIFPEMIKILTEKT